MYTILKSGACGLDRVNQADNIEERAKLNERRLMPLPSGGIKDGSLGISHTHSLVNQ